MRRLILLALPEERFHEDRAFYKLFLALVVQCIANEHVWPQSAAETRAPASVDMDETRLLSGDIGQSRHLALKLLYSDIEDMVSRELSATEIARIRPKSCAALLAGYVRDRAGEKQLAESIPRCGEITDPVSLRVAGQYEKNPYPRWASLHVSQPGALRRHLTRIADEEKLLFMDAPFDVLIAGCGTGHQAALAASAYVERTRWFLA